MTVTRLTPGELRGHLGLGDPYAPAPALAGLVDLARLALARWRTAPRRELLRYLREQVEACGWEPTAHRDRIHQSVDLLISRREIAELDLEGQPHLVAGILRLVVVGDQTFLCGCLDAALPGAHDNSAPADDEAPVRWLDTSLLGVDDTLAEAEEISLEDWVGEPALFDHLRRREGAGHTPHALWEALQRRFHGADPVGDGAGYRVVCGEPGEYFGGARGPNGRWRDALGAPDGRWCGARGGYGDEATSPVLVEVRGGQPVRALQLFDWDELEWLLYGRGVAEGRPERLGLDGATLSFASPLPKQLRVVLQAITTPAGPWRHLAPSTAVAEALHGLLARWLGEPAPG